MHAKYECPISYNKKFQANNNIIQKKVKGQGQVYMFKIYGTVGGPCHKEHTYQIWNPICYSRC